MRVIIHSCDKRLWFVRDFLAPELKRQGLDVSIHNDDDHRGCLWSYVSSFRGLKRDSDGGAWHLQDDVYPCRDFAEIAAEHDAGVVYGFFHRHAADQKMIPGPVSVMRATYSFPCIRIPDRMAVEFAEWILADAQYRDKYQPWIAEKKYVDAFWRDFLREKYTDSTVYNLMPSIVEHVDQWMGGSTINFWREGWCHAEYFDDHETIEDLKVKLAAYKKPLF